MVECVEVAACVCELGDPFFGLAIIELGELYFFFGIWSGRDIPTSAIIMWQSKVPFPRAVLGRWTWGRSLDTTGAPKVMLGTKWPSMISIWSLHILRIEQLAPRFGEWMGICVCGHGVCLDVAPG